MQTRLLAVLDRQLEPCLRMLDLTVEACPDDLWLRDDGSGFIFWHHVYHVTFFVDYWIRDDYGRGVDFRSMNFDRDLPVGLDRRSSAHLTRDEARDYVRRVRNKTRRVLEALDDGDLLAPVVSNNTTTYLDVILGQIRHVQHHVGQLNRVLDENRSQPVSWIAHNERG